jgi:hypothetical protein
LCVKQRHTGTPDWPRRALEKSAKVAQSAYRMNTGGGRQPGSTKRAAPLRAAARVTTRCSENTYKITASANGSSQISFIG